MQRQTDILQVRFEVAGDGKVRVALADTAQGLDRVEKQGRQTNAMWDDMRLALAGIGLAAFGREIVQTGLKIEKIEASLKAGVGTSKRAQQELAFLRNETERLGLVFLTTSERVAGFYAATRGTEVADDVRNITTAFLEASAVYRLTEEQIGGVFRALEQMVSKGRVSAEELRGQLGERLYGAFILAAESIGVTTQELDKMLELGQLAAGDLLPRLADQLREVVSKDIGDAANSNYAALNRFQNVLDRTEAQLAEGGLLDALGTLASAMGTIITKTLGATKALGEFGAQAAANADGNFAGTLGALGPLAHPLLAPLAFFNRNALFDTTTLAGRSQLDLAKVTERLEDRRTDLSHLESYASQPSSVIDRITGEVARERAAIEADITALEAEQARLLALVNNLETSKAPTYGNYTGDIIRETDANFVGPPSRLASAPRKPFTPDIDTDRLDRDMKEIEARLLSLTGSAFDAASIEIELKYEDLLERLKKAGRDTSLVEDLIDVEKAQARFSEFEDSYRDVLSNLSQEVQRIQQNVNAGLISEAEGRRQIIDLQRQTAAQLENEYLPALRDVAETIGPEGEKAINQVIAAIERLRTSSNPAISEIRAGMESAFSGFLQQTLRDIDSVGDAFEGLKDSILDTFNRLIAEMASKAIVRQIFRMFGLNMTSVDTGASGYSVGGMGPPSSLAGTNHTGGIAGVADAGQRMVPSYLFSGARKFHAGGLVGDEVPIIAKRGEGVFTPEQMAALGPSSGVKVEVHNYGNQEARVEESRTSDGRTLIRLIIGEVAGDIRRGGGVGRAIESTYGARRVGA